MTRDGLPLGTVLVTGGSGFLGSHAIRQLLEAGYAVRATVRNRERAAGVLAALGGIAASGRLSCHVANLEQDDGWRDAAAGCAYVLHIASPFPATAPRHEDELVVPAREGTLRVLRASRDAGVRRVVLTSSFAAVGYGHPPQERPFTEADWSDPTGELPAYIKSKTLAERAAWEFLDREGGQLELTAINPVGIFGPLLGTGYPASVALVKKLLDGALGCPRLYFGMVDVRDAADLHIRAMTRAAARGERFLAVAGEPMSLHGVARILRRRLGRAARKVPRWQTPDWMVRLAARWDPELRPLVPQLGRMRRASNEKARRVLDWVPRGNEEIVVATGESLVESGLAGPGSRPER